MFKGNKTQYHAGIHVVVLHPHRFTVLQKEQFFTWQPAAHRMLTKMIKHTQYGRIVILVGVVSHRWRWLLRRRDSQSER